MSTDTNQPQAPRRPRHYTQDEVQQRFNRALAHYGSPGELARAAGVVPSAISDIVSGRRGIGGELLRFLGLERQECYRSTGQPTEQVTIADDDDAS